MTPKFDNLASLLMEMPKLIPNDIRLEIAEYIEQVPEATYTEIADAFGVSPETAMRIGKEFGILRRSRIKGKETHQCRKLTDVQEKQIFDYWMVNHHDTTLSELARRVKQQFNVDMGYVSMLNLLKRTAAKQKPPVQLPPSDRGKGRRLMKQRSQHRNEPGTGKLPTQGSQYFKGSTDIVPSNPKHGGPAHPPK